jgi:hypothetical protein
MMTIRQFLPYTTALAMAFLPGLVRADVTLDSGAGLAACMFNLDASSCTNSFNGVTTTGSSIAFGITAGSQTMPDTAWAGSNPTNPGDPSDKSAVWIGAVDSGESNTGHGTFVPSNTTSGNSLPGATNPTGGGAPVYQITSQSFIAGASSTLSLDVWADDSVDVFLVNATTPGLTTEISLPGTSAQGTNCSPQKVGCLTTTEGIFPGISLLAGDTYSLQFDVWQTGTGGDNSSNPTGLLYTGFASGAVAAPEPGAATLLVTMLMVVAGFAGILKKKLA